MAQQQSVLGIFGLTPEMYSQRRQDELEAEQLSVGKMSSGPGSLLNPSMANIYGLATQQGQMIGQGVKGLLGVEDPQMQMVRDVQSMRSQFDVSTPAGLRQFAQALGQRGYSDLAIQAAAKAADIDKELSAAQKNRTETVKQVGLTTDGRQVYQSGANQFILTEQGPQPYYGALESKRAKTEVNVGAPDTKNKAFEIADPEALKEYRKSSRAASGQLTLINQARQNLPTAVVGQGLPSLIRGLNTQLAPLGINVDKVAGTRNLEQALKSIIAQGIKQYGANPSTVDLQFAEKAASDIQDPRKAIEATLQYLENKARKEVDKQDAAEQWLLNKGNLAGFEKAWTQQENPKAGKRTKTLSSGLVVEIED